MVVTIDGPAGAGKSTVARALARRLGVPFLDTGAMYRAATLAAMRRGIPLTDAEALARLVGSLRIQLDGERVLLDGEEVTAAIRTPAVTENIHFAADNPLVRDQMVARQRAAAAGGDFVAEGRDQGTVVFPDAVCKIFLTASAEERARRRQEEYRARGEDVSFEEVLAQQQQRDRRDQTRPVGALRRAEDAVEVVTDGMRVEEVVDRLEQIVRGRGFPASRHAPDPSS